MRHVLFLISQDSTKRGGSEEIMGMVVRYFLKQGDDVHVFFLMKKRFGDWEKIPFNNLHLYYSRGGGKLGIFSVIRNFWRVHNKVFDYSFSSIVECTGLIGIMSRLGILHIESIVGRESTMVFSRFSGMQLWINKMMYRFGYPAVKLLICQTQLMKNELLSYVPWLENGRTVAVIPNPVDFDKIHEKEVQVINVKNYVPYVVTAGRLHPVKGYDVLIKSFNIFLKDHPDFKLIILGRDGGQGEQLQRIISELDLQNKVILHGEVDNVYPFFKQAQLCVISSFVEGFPNVLLQMMSQSNKVVSTVCAGGIDNIKGLFTCPPNNVELLAQAMVDCINADTGKNKELFEIELQSRSFDMFIQKIFSYTS